MKTITIKLSDEVYADVRENAKIRCMLGNSNGIMDLVVIKIIQGMENGEDTVELSFNDKDAD